MIFVMGVLDKAEHVRLTVFRILTLSGVNDGRKRLVTEFRQRFVLIASFSTASLLNEGMNRHVSHHVEVIEQSFGFLVRKIGTLKECSAHLGSDAACLRVRTC
jgi:hypothetical protein